jgi:hypothetical protein
MSARDPHAKTTISSDGLRYTAKEPGTAFGGFTLGNSAVTMSCFKCGCHKPLSKLLTKKILGRNQKGFELAWQNMRFAGTARHTQPAQAAQIVPIGVAEFGALCALDRRLFPASREAFLRCWIAMPDSNFNLEVN